MKRLAIAAPAKPMTIHRGGRSAAIVLQLLLMPSFVSAAPALPPYSSYPPSPPAGYTPLSAAAPAPVPVTFSPVGCTTNCVLMRNTAPYFIKRAPLPVP